MKSRPALMIPLVLAGYFVFATARASIGVVFPEMKDELKLGDVELGVVASSFSGSSMVTTAVAGYLWDRVGGVSYLAGLLVLSSGLLLTAVARTYVSVLLCFLTFGLGMGILLPAVYGTIGKVKPTSRGYWTGVAVAVYGAGGIAGPTLTGLLSFSVGWRGPFEDLGLLGLLIGAAYYSFYRLDASLTQTPDSVEKNKRAILREVLRNRNVRLLCVMMMASNFSWTALLAWEPTFLRRVQSYDATSTGIVFACLFVGSMVGAIALGRLSDKYSRRLAIFLSGLVSALLSCVSYILAPPILVTAVLLVALGSMAGPYWSLQIALSQDSVDSSAIGTATGLIQNAALVTGAIAPTVAGALSSSVGWGITLILTVSLPLLVYAVVALALQSK